MHNVVAPPGCFELLQSDPATIAKVEQGLPYLEYLLKEAIEGMDSKLKSRIAPGAKRALALLGNGGSEGGTMLKALA